MKKLSLVCLFLIMNLLQPCPQSVHAQDVESFVRDFYKWYLKQSLSFGERQSSFEDLPVFDPGIVKYVCRCTAKRVQFDYNRGVGGNGADYYIKGQDVVKEQLEDFKIGGSIDVSDNLRLVSVSMRKEYSPYIVVYVEKTNGSMCISKVEDSPGPNFRAPVY